MFIRAVSHPRRGQGVFALRFIAAAIIAGAISGILGFLLTRLYPAAVAARAVRFPAPFWVSTVLLAAGSLMLHRACGYVRVERQRPFRRCLFAALITGTAFVGVQSCGLWRLLASRSPGATASGGEEFVFVMTTLHCAHFTLAQLMLVFVVLRARADAYDHEGYWGVVVCAWFWHFLGGVWGVLLATFGIFAWFDRYAQPL